jgi:histone acetyltransferase MYST1
MIVDFTQLDFLVKRSKPRHITLLSPVHVSAISCRYSDLGYNLACILAFPSAQRRGFGRLLIQFSYELSKKEEKVGSPEKPLSDLGAVSYKSYWASSVLMVLKHYPGQSISVMDLTRMTSILADDVIATLQLLELLQFEEDHQQHVLCCPPGAIDALIEKYPQGSLTVDPALLNWAPLYVVDWKKDKWSIKAKKDSEG